MHDFSPPNCPVLTIMVWVWNKVVLEPQLFLINIYSIELAVLESILFKA